jgi:diaminopimelate epimerase
MDYTLAHGTGNDFVVIADLDDQLEVSEVLVQALCNRRLGLGADGILRIGGSVDGDVFMDHRNADGSIVEMCGNGVRVVAKYVVDRGIVTGDDVLVDTRDGIKTVRVRRGEDGLVLEATVDMGRPSIAPGEWLDVDGIKVEVVSVGIGNPHAIVRVEDVATAPVRTLGPRIESHERFPDGVNVEFAQIVGPADVRLRVWERGVGETAACGTGACATQAALRALDLVGDDVTIHLPGGDLRVYWSANNEGARMTGPAVEIASGTLGAAWLAAAQRGEITTEVLS